MMKITILGIVLVAVALSGVISVTYFEPTILPSQHAQDDIQANEADAPPIKAAADVSFGDAPLLTLSRLPNLNETAIVEITYTNTVGADLVDPELFSAGTTNWDLSTEFEIVDAGGLEYEILGSDERLYPGYTVYSAFVPLRADESITYRLEIRAVAEGPARIAATYLGGAEINLYIDAEETLLLRDYAKKHPEWYTMTQPVVPKSDTARYVTEEDLKNAPTTVGQPTREETMDTFTKYLKNSGDTVEWAVESLLQTGILNATELRTVLANVGFTEDEISDGMPSAASAETVPSPLQQVRDGVPTSEVMCSENRVLMVSQTGMPACVFEESVLELETRGFEFIGEPFDMFPINSSDMADSTLWTGDPPPVITMSRLPNIGETAIVEINFTNAVWGDVTDTERYRTGFFETGWKISSKFEIVDSGGLKYEPIHRYETNEITGY